MSLTAFEDAAASRLGAVCVICGTCRTRGNIFHRALTTGRHLSPDTGRLLLYGQHLRAPAQQLRRLILDAEGHRASAPLRRRIVLQLLWRQIHSRTGERGRGRLGEGRCYGYVLRKRARCPLPICIPHAERGDPAGEVVLPAVLFDAVHGVLPERHVRVPVERRHEPTQDRPEHLCPYSGLVAEFVEASRTVEQSLPVLFRALESDGGEPACYTASELEVSVIKG